MFGYLQPYKDEMKIKDYQFYKSVYCGLCRHLTKDYGLLASLTLSYDCTVLAMLYLSVNNENFAVKKGRCTVNPLKKCMICDSSGNAFRFAGAVSVIMSYYKMKDTIADSGILKKIAAVCIMGLLHRNYKKAKKVYPEIDVIVSEMMEMQSEAEKNNSGIDRSAEPTALLIKKLCIMLSPDKNESHALGVFGYFVGRWIYLMDAADDLEKDLKHNNFNPFAAKHNNDIIQTMIYCNEVLNMTASQILLSYELLPVRSCKAVLDNIVMEGLPYQQKKYTEDRYQNRKKNNKTYKGNTE